jgi:hypothetical protein
MSLINEDGTPLFPDIEEGVAVLEAKSGTTGRTFLQATQAAEALSGLVPVTEVAAKLPNAGRPSAGSISPRASARRSRSSKQQ